jgi:signal transduction histidine kinase
VKGSYMLRLAIGRTLTALVAALVLGWILFYGLTGRLRRLADGMDGFRERGLVPDSLRGGGERGGGDELDRLRTSFVALADRVTAQIDELMRADVQRRELVAGISHDLRTPLTILRGYLETLQVKEGMLDAEDRRRSLEAALRQAENVSELVTQLFELATLDGSTLEVHREDFSIAELVQDVAQKFSLRAEQKGVVLETDHGVGLPFVVGDLRLVERVLDNLLDNAVRHTPSGGTVTISCRNGGSRVQVEVADNGEGIAEREQARIFEPFYHSRADGGGGSVGLGLAIVRRILELHGSTVEVESERGHGARFRFRLPIA